MRGAAQELVFHKCVSCLASEVLAGTNLGLELLDSALEAAEGSLLASRGFIPCPSFESKPLATQLVQLVNGSEGEIFNGVESKYSAMGPAPS